MELRPLPQLSWILYTFPPVGAKTFENCEKVNLSPLSCFHRVTLCHRYNKKQRTLLLPFTESRRFEVKYFTVNFSLLAVKLLGSKYSLLVSTLPSSTCSAKQWLSPLHLLRGNDRMSQFLVSANYNVQGLCSP